MDINPQRVHIRLKQKREFVFLVQWDNQKIQRVSSRSLIVKFRK